jgi:hypothetical protein
MYVYILSRVGRERRARRGEGFGAGAPGVASAQQRRDSSGRAKLAGARPRHGGRQALAGPLAHPRLDADHGLRAGEGQRLHDQTDLRKELIGDTEETIREELK